MLKRIQKKINQSNDKVAVFLTKKLVGTMWCAYLFAAYGLLGLAFPDSVDKLTFWSNWPQLWLLPVLLVSANLLDKANERRQRETHDMVKAELELVKKLVKKQEGGQ